MWEWGARVLGSSLGVGGGSGAGLEPGRAHEGPGDLGQKLFPENSSKFHCKPALECCTHSLVLGLSFSEDLVDFVPWMSHLCSRQGSWDLELFLECLRPCWCC